ncbi:DUF1681-domain-containing protein [Eremomyces bilateralis CBS 781.70]|uniref:DUF1681-domain-containing protein n=1 Tax=Eremomyces bilateralis CBS 781.70 TaxID=1392243 RepID=A0A6G1FX29_9PEZI|nr:DUF1681-domain-containing protein [Eremomyces bilateralis CBS 781.70]KAF1810397.1 DUF1681-domain-containing protein [Eremomyces bilateralis CBS 781.70]
MSSAMNYTDPVTNRPLPPETIQRVLYIANAVHVYQIPPITSASGFKAASWTSNPKSHIFTARLRIIENSVPATARAPEKVAIYALLEDAKEATLFAACPYLHPSSIEQAQDSSRFFAVRVVGDGGMKATLGIGFEERPEAFDFSVALQDVRRQLDMDVAQGPGARGKASGRAAPSTAAEEKKDFSLKEGETITINLGNKTRTSSGQGFGSADAVQEQRALFSLAPPPTGGVNTGTQRSSWGPSSFPSPPKAPDKKEAEEFGFDDGEFGEFQ